MGAARKLELTDELRRRYEAGDETQASIAALFGVSRQAVHAALKRAGWRTPAPCPPSPSTDQPAPHPTAPASTPPTDLPLEADSHPAAEVERIHDPYRDMREPAHRLLVQSSLRVLQETNTSMLRTSGQNSPQSLKRYMEVINLVANTLGRIAFFADPNDAAEQLTTLRIEVMTEEEENAIRTEAERQTQFSQTGWVEDEDNGEGDLTGFTAAAAHAQACARRTPRESARDVDGDDTGKASSADGNEGDEDAALPVDLHDSASLALWLETLARRHGRRLLSDLSRLCGYDGSGSVDDLISRLRSVAETDLGRIERALAQTRATWQHSVSHGAPETGMSAQACASGRD